MTELSKKEQIQISYNQKIAVFGDKIYRLCVPFLEVLEQAQVLLELNRRMYKLLDEEKKAGETPIE